MRLRLCCDGAVRTDGPSLTARIVAVHRAELDRPSTPTGDPDADDRLCADLAQGFGDVGYDVFEWVAARTRFFDAEILDAIAWGVRQVVILGAGYDGRALRFRSPGVTFFEVDHPHTQADKRQRLDRLAAGTDGLTFVAHDLAGGGLSPVLAGAGHDASRPTLFLAEGLLRYLPEATVHELFTATRERAAPGSVFALTFSTREDGADVDPEVGLREAFLADLGETVLTLPSRATALEWLADAGWRVDAVDDVTSSSKSDGDGRLLIRATLAG